MMTKEFWMNSQLSVARFYGGCKMGGHRYLIVGYEADLVRDDFIEYYAKLGREKFMETLRLCPDAEGKELKEHFEELLAEKKGVKPEMQKKEQTINFE